MVDSLHVLSVMKQITQITNWEKHSAKMKEERHMLLIDFVISYIKSMGSSTERGCLSWYGEICDQKWRGLYPSVFLIVLLSDLI